MAMNPDNIPSTWNTGSGNIIMAVGVGGGGSNAVNYMFKSGVENVDFVVCNTDMQSLEASPVPNRLQLGQILTKGLGAGTDAVTGRKAAEESAGQIRELFDERIEMVFITCGMGGGTGTGAAPVVASICRELGKLTVGVVTIPFRDEGEEALSRAIEGIREMSRQVDSLLIIDNQKLYELYGSLEFTEGFHKADEVLCTAVRSIADVITRQGHINADMADVRRVMSNSGVALMGIGTASGPDRVDEAVRQALTSPLLQKADISSAKRAIVNITASGEADSGMKLEEMSRIMDQVREAAGGNLGTSKRGVVIDPRMGDKISITVIMTGFEMAQLPLITRNKKNVIEVKYDPFSFKSEKRGLPLQPETTLNINGKLSFDGVPSLCAEDAGEQYKLEEEPAYYRREMLIKKKQADNQI